MSRALRSTFSSLREYLTPVSNTSTFQSTGEITPEEFLAAGDYLVDKFPTWQWAAASKGKAKGFLPPDKQFLVTKHVPCAQRASSLDVGGEEEDGEWVISKNTQTAEALDVDFDELKDLEEPDLEPELDAPPLPQPATQSQLRLYNVYISYSTSYRVPKLYLEGFTSEGTPLAPKLMFEDIQSDYKDKTATIEPAPFLDGLTLISIHPCRHAGVMRLLLDKSQSKSQSEDDWEEVPLQRVDTYLVLFLKFIAGVTPTIEHDFTMSA